MSLRPFRVLSLDGGGMRGIYTATYLSELCEVFAKRRNVRRLDLGKAFDLIVGTSTGAIVGCALAAGVNLEDVIKLYRENGRNVFNRRLPRWKIGYVVDLANRGDSLKNGAKVLEKSLASVFKDLTLGDVYKQRQIALAIPAVELGHHRSWVFKTPHAAGTNHRDDKYSLVSVCMATSAAPIYRSLAALDRPDGSGDFNVFADGGLWANNPVLVAIIEALEISTPDREIEVFSLGTCPRPEGEQVGKHELDRGILEWQGGGAAAALSIDAQEFAFDNMARMLVKHTRCKCEIIRFPSGKAPAAKLHFLVLPGV